MIWIVYVTSAFYAIIWAWCIVVVSRASENKAAWKKNKFLTVLAVLISALVAPGLVVLVGTACLEEEH